MKNSIIILLCCIIIYSLFYIINISNEHFYIENPEFNQYYFTKPKYNIQTWTPYFIDKYYQPRFNNYFYYDGYMYPIRNKF